MESVCCRSAGPQHGRRHSVTARSCRTCCFASRQTSVATLDANPGSLVVKQPRPSGLEDILEAARRLPVCDRAAKIHAIIARLQYNVRTGTATSTVTDELAAAAADALADDPWVQFEAIVHRL